MFRRSIALAVLLLMTFNGLTMAAGSAAYSRTFTSSYNDCRVARYEHLLSTSTACHTYAYWGAVTLRTYRITDLKAETPVQEPEITLASCDWRQYGCYSMPNPNVWYYVDSYDFARGPASLWQVSIVYHFRVNGYQLVETQSPSCEYFEVGMSININSCRISAYQTSTGTHYEIGVRWRECFVNPILGFCATKGLTMITNGRASVLSRSVW